MKITDVLNVARCYHNYDLKKFATKEGFNTPLFLDSMNKNDIAFLIRALGKLYGSFVDKEDNTTIEEVAKRFNLFITDLRTLTQAATKKLVDKDAEEEETDENGIKPRLGSDYDMVIDYVIEVGKMGISIEIENLHDLMYIPTRRNINYYNEEIRKMLPDLNPMMTDLYNKCPDTLPALQDRFEHCQSQMNVNKKV